MASLAIQRLARDPASVVPFLKSRLAPVDGKKIARWLGDLDAEEFAKRRAAFSGLAELGRFAEGSIRQALAKKPNLEKHRRLEELLDKMTDEKRTSEHQRALRAVEVLGMAGTPEARKLLETLAGGAAEAELTPQGEVGSLAEEAEVELSKTIARYEKHQEKEPPRKGEPPEALLRQHR